MRSVLCIPLYFYRNLILGLADWMPDTRFFNYGRWIIYKYLLGLRVGHKSMFSVGVRFPVDAFNNIVIGDATFINSDVRIDCRGASVIIGDRVLIGAGTSFDTGSHLVELDEYGRRPRICKPIIVENEVWLGTNVSVLQGIIIGEGSVVAAGSVLTKDVPPNTLVGGVPARIIKRLKIQ